MTTGAPLVAKVVAGYWCEWWASEPNLPEPRRIQSCPVASPSNALRWTRAGPHMIVSALGEAAAYAFDWLESDPRETEAALGRGEPVRVRRVVR